MDAISETSKGYLVGGEVTGTSVDDDAEVGRIGKSGASSDLDASGSIHIPCVKSPRHIPLAQTNDDSQTSFIMEECKRMIAYPRLRSSFVSPRRLGKPCVDSLDFGDSDLTLPTITSSSSEDTSFSHYLESPGSSLLEESKESIAYPRYRVTRVSSGPQSTLQTPPGQSRLICLENLNIPLPILQDMPGGNDNARSRALPRSIAPFLMHHPVEVAVTNPESAAASASCLVDSSLESTSGVDKGLQVLLEESTQGVLHPPSPSRRNSLGNRLRRATAPILHQIDSARENSKDWAAKEANRTNRNPKLKWKRSRSWSHKDRRRNSTPAGTCSTPTKSGLHRRSSWNVFLLRSPNLEDRGCLFD
jgi:hypothetical protein